MLKALLDSGAGASLIAEKHCANLKTIAKKASFRTVAGKFYTAGVVKTAFRLAKLNPTASPPSQNTCIMLGKILNMLRKMPLYY
eukprot:13557879-Ditylum_brightwellii.AAC.1